MKINPLRFPRHQRGMALISVLAVLVLLTVLVVAFVARTTSARASSSSYHATANTRVLADTAVNLVQAQINEATTQGLNAGAATYTWGSQPGAIRVFDNDGNLSSIYRLYSAAPTPASSARVIGVTNNNISGALTQLANDLPSNTNWTSNGAQWVDLNAFVRDSQNNYHFPIIDPRDTGAPSTQNPTASGAGTLWQPTSSNPALKGFCIQPTSGVGNSTNPAPMPLQWLYVLKDGSIVSPDATTTYSNVLTFNHALNSAGQADVPSATNPIVGRIAYWTDDESCKININTAAGDDVVRSPNTYASNSIFWATPVFCSPDDVNLAQYQPINGEIQRYSGHPGTVGLNTTLSTLAGLSTPLTYAEFFGDGTASNPGVLPRYTGGGSISATVRSPYTLNAAATPVPLTASRLYTSVGEMLFNASRSHSALINDTASEAAAAAAVERSNFFLTAHSSSSELNLFGEPRVSIWPITTAHAGYSAAQSQTPVDALLMFDSTIRTTAGNEQFYFQRTDPTSPSIDCNIANNLSLFTYLDKLTSSPIPGFGSATATAPGSISSNFTTNKYPNSATQNPPAMRQILAEIFDYIRTTNMIDPVVIQQTPLNGTGNQTYGQSWGAPSQALPYPGGVQVVPSANPSAKPGHGIVFNGTASGAQGVGSFPVPMEVAIDFVAMGVGSQPKQGIRAAVSENPIPIAQYEYGTYPAASPNSVGHDVGTALSYDNILDDTTANAAINTGINTNLQSKQAPYYGLPPQGTTAMQAFIYVSFINPSLITSTCPPAYVYSITGLNTLSVQGYVSGTGATTVEVPLHFPGTNVTTIGYNNWGTGVPKPVFGTAGDEETMLVDGSNFLNGWIGNWCFGYIPFIGSTGNGNGGDPGMLGVQQTVWTNSNTATCAVHPQSNPNPMGYTVSPCRFYPYYSQLFALPGQQGWAGSSNVNPLNTFAFNGSNGNPITIKIYDFHAAGKSIAPTSSDLVSSYSFVFPAANNLPLPSYTTAKFGATGRIVGTLGNSGTDFTAGSDAYGSGATDRWNYSLSVQTGGDYWQWAIEANDVCQSVTLSPSWSDARDLAVNSVGPASTAGSPNVPVFVQHPNYDNTTPGAIQSGSLGGSANSQIMANMAHSLLGDAQEPMNGNMNPEYWGRLVTQTVPAFSINGASFYTGSSTASYIPTQVSSLYGREAGWLYPSVPPMLNGPPGTSLTGVAGLGAYTTTGAPGDWDNGLGDQNDGPWVNMADQGALQTNTGGNVPVTFAAYYEEGNSGQKTGIPSTFSPNRMMPSPVMFGSLPTGVNQKNPKPWQTLLFQPGAGAGGFGSSHPGEKNQPGAGDPPDHLLLDLFWMPQAEPYPISQPFVTEGKINLNYEIQPFTYITRDTALRALLAGEEIAVMPDSLAYVYKNGNVAGNGPSNGATTGLMSQAATLDANGNTRLPIDPDQTLGLAPLPATASTSYDPRIPTSGTGTTNTAQTGTNAWFDATQSPKVTRFFKSPSELCEMFLVPQGYDWTEFSGLTFDQHSWYMTPKSLAGVANQHGDFALVGDNVRERPYSDLYSRVTTKSNTYTVYYTVQSLKNAEPLHPASGHAGQETWDESVGTVTGEYRGSSTLERYLDPNEDLPDFLGHPGAASLEPYYKWRVVSTRQFAP